MALHGTSQNNTFPSSHHSNLAFVSENWFLKSSVVIAIDFKSGTYFAVLTIDTDQDFALILIQKISFLVSVNFHPVRVLIAFKVTVIFGSFFIIMDRIGIKNKGELLWRWWWLHIREGLRMWLIRRWFLVLCQRSW